MARRTVGAAPAPLFSPPDGMRPLADRMRPRALDEVVGQDAILGPGAALRRLVEGGRLRELVLTRVDGEPVATSGWRARLEEAGFVPGYRGHVLRPASRRVVVAGRGLAPETATAGDYWRGGRGRG